MADTGEPVVQIERKPVSIAQLIGWAVIIIVQAFTAGTVYMAFKADITDMQQDIAEIEEYRRTRSNSTDSNFADLRAKLQPLDNLTYRLGQSEARDTAQDQRIDRIVESFGDKLDAISSDVGIVKSDVRVLSQQVQGSLTEKAKPTVFTLPSPP